MGELEGTHNLINEIINLATPKRDTEKDTSTKGTEEEWEDAEDKNKTPKNKPKQYKTTFSTMGREKLRANKKKEDSYVWDNYTSTPSYETKQQQITSFLPRRTNFKRKPRSPQEIKQDEKRTKKQTNMSNKEMIESILGDTL